MSWTPYYHTRNLKTINELAPNTRELAKKLYTYCVQNKIDILIYEARRSVEQQRINVKKGASQTMRSYHIVGQALDFVPVVGGKTIWEGYGTAPVKNMITYAKSLGFIWGGDWKNFRDSPHLQYEYNGYGTDTKLKNIVTGSVNNTPINKTLIVKKGDSLSKLFGSNWRNIAALNNIKAPGYVIKAGQTLKY